MLEPNRKTDAIEYTNGEKTIYVSRAIEYVARVATWETFTVYEVKDGEYFPFHLSGNDFKKFKRKEG